MPTRAKRGAQSKLALAAFRPHQKKVGNVGARNEQNDSNSAEHNPKQRAYVTDNLLFQRAKIWTESSLPEQVKAKTWPHRKGVETDRKHSCNIRASLGDGSSRFQSSDPKITEVSQRYFIAVQL